MEALPNLHAASATVDTDSVKYLLSSGDDSNALYGECGVAPLHLAAQQGNFLVAEALLSAGAHLNLQAPKTGLTPLITAVCFREVQMVEFFLRQPRINIELRAVFGGKAIDLIGFGTKKHDKRAAEENRKMLLLFLEYEQSVISTVSEQPLFTDLQDIGLTAQQRADSVRAALGQNALAQVNFRSPITSSGDDGLTPLLMAARDGHDEAISVLLAAGTDQTMADEYMRAVPAHKAAFNGHDSVLALLVEAPGFSDVMNAQGPFNGYTPLYDAVWRGHVDAVKVLLQAGASSKISGHNGMTPTDLARKYGYDDIVVLLERATDE